VTARKAERLMNLTICLLVSRGPITKSRIRQAVEGYHDLSDEAFDRMFDRDKEELRVLGVPIEVAQVDKGFEDEVGYRIRRDRFELPEISLEADEAAVVGLAARVWQHARMAAATTDGLRKLRAGGIEVDETALTILEPQLASDEPAFDAVFEAVVDRRPLAFEYQRPGDVRTSERRVEPWGILSWHGHWYVVGHDPDRDAPRMFRVSRIVGQVRWLGEPGSYEVPADVNLRELAGQLAPPHPHSSARIAVRPGAGDALRRRAVRSRPLADGWTEIEVPYGSGTSLVEELLSLGPDVVVQGPDEIRDGVLRRLSLLAGQEV